MRLKVAALLSVREKCRGAHEKETANEDVVGRCDSSSGYSFISKWLS